MNPTRQSIFLFTLTLLSSCALGATEIRRNRFDYNTAIQQTSKQQLLANLIRMKHNDVPLFLDVSTVTVQHQAQGNLGGTGTFPGGELSGALQYNETPTITYTPLQGDALVKQLMSPIDPAVIVNLYHSGWSIEWLLFLIVDRLTPRRDQFNEAIHTLQSLDDLGALDLLVAPSSKESTPTVVVINGPQPTNERRAAIPGGTLVIAVDANNSSNRSQALSLLSKLNQLFDLTPSGKSFAAFEIQQRAMPFDMSGLGQSAFPRERSNSGSKSSAAEQPKVLPVSHTRVRSPIGALKFAAETASISPAPSVDTPRSEWSSSDASATLTIVESDDEPATSYTSVRYGDRWFSIRDNDDTSRFIFALLAQLLAMQSSSSTGPQLTLPAGK